MGALFGGQKQNKVVSQTVPEPETTAEPTAIGGARKQEDEALFGSTSPELRTNRTATPPGVAASGSGLKLM